jgi:hypothetical protein
MKALEKLRNPLDYEESGRHRDNRLEGVNDGHPGTVGRLFVGSPGMSRIINAGDKIKDHPREEAEKIQNRVYLSLPLGSPVVV